MENIINIKLLILPEKRFGVLLLKHVIKKCNKKQVILEQIMLKNLKKWLLILQRITQAAQLPKVQLIKLGLKRKTKQKSNLTG